MIKNTALNKQQNKNPFFGDFKDEMELLSKIKIYFPVPQLWNKCWMFLFCLSLTMSLCIYCFFPPIHHCWDGMGVWVCIVVLDSLKGHFNSAFNFSSQNFLPAIHGGCHCCYFKSTSQSVIVLLARSLLMVYWCIQTLSR